MAKTNGAQSSRVPTPLPDDPYVAVRQAHLVDTDTKSEPLGDLKETKIPQQAYTPAVIDTESEPEEAPSKLEEFLPLVSRAPLLMRSLRLWNHRILGPPHHIPQLHRIPPHYYHPITYLLRLHPPLHLPKLRSTRYRSLYETPYPTLLVRKKYREDKGPDSKGEEAAPKSQQQVVQVADTTIDKLLGLGYGAARHRALNSTKEITPNTFEVGQSSRSVLALEAWARHVDAQRAEMWQARYDDHRLIHDMLVQHTAMQRELQEMRGRVATLE
ncbi:hypothetical protein Tco_0930207 [Tanacetum coccineum]